MAVINGSPLLLREVAAAGGGSNYQIEKSLRFNSADSARLDFTPLANGNRRTWTYSTWVKLGSLSLTQRLLGANGPTNPSSNLGPDGRLHFQRGTNGKIACGDGSSNYFFSDALFRDPSAWYHVVFAVDTTEPLEKDRMRIYVNNQLVAFNGKGASAQAVNEELAVNKALTQMNIGVGENQYGDQYLADPQFIDGLKLTPAAFGEYDSLNVWNPKAFKLPTPNQNQDYSDASNWSASTGTLSEIDEAFKGNMGKWGPSLAASASSLVTFTPDTEIDCIAGIEVGNWGAGGTIYINKGETDEVAVPMSETYTNYVQGPTSRKIKNIAINATSGTVAISGFKVDGIELIDNKTDPTTFINPNNHTDWASKVTFNAGDWNANSGALSFDGNDTTNNYASLTKANNGWATLSLADFAGDNKTIKVTAEQTILTLTHAGGTSSFTPPDTSKVTHTFPTVTLNSSSTLKLEGLNSGSVWVLNLVKVNDVPLINDSVDNSFHLKFSDIAANRNLGYSEVMNTCTGAQPMYGPGASDSAKSDLVLALPGYDLNDHHHTIKGSGSAKTITANGNTTTSATKTKFYDKAIYFDGDGDYLTTGSNTDFATGTGAFTYELWVYWINESTNASLGGTRGSGNDANAWSIAIIPGSGNRIQMWTDDANNLTTGGITAEQWTHFACVRDGSNNMKFYINGKEESSDTVNNDFSTSGTGLTLGDDGGSGANEFKGYVQDVRFYKGTAKYTSAFTPPTRNDFTVNNLTHDSGAMYSSGTTSGSLDSGPWSLAFNGTTGATSYVYENTIGTPARLTFPNPITVTGLVRVFGSNGSNGVTTSGDDLIRFGYNDGSTSSDLDVGGTLFSNATWHNITGSDSWNTIEWIELEKKSGGQGPCLFAVEIGGTVLVDTGPENQDSLVDTPTNYGTDERNGGEVRGNYPTFNPLIAQPTGGSLSQGNLTISTTSSGEFKGFSSMAIPANTGKWYFEITVEKKGNDCKHSLYRTDASTLGVTLQDDDGASGDVFGYAIDQTAGTWVRYKNGSSDSNGTHDEEYDWLVRVYDWQNSAKSHINFGQRAFKYTAPAGYKCLCTQNLPDLFSGEDAGTVNNPSKYFDILTYTGNEGTQSIKGLSFQPDLLWLKNRDSDTDHQIYDAVRGTGTHGLKRLKPNLNNAEANGDSSNTVNFLSDGFSLSGGGGDTNDSGKAYISWNWDAGTAASGANEAGSINISAGDQWVNTTAGFSITKYTGTGSAASIGHGLNDQPKFILIKEYGASGDNWLVGHVGITLGTGRIVLNSTGGNNNSYGTEYWNDTAATDTLIHLGSDSGCNGSNDNYICYAWTAIPGYSAFGKYSGNSSADGPFIYCGFKPRYFWVKKIDNTDSNSGWHIYDTSRDTQNQSYKFVVAESAYYETRAANNTADVTSYYFDFVSNGIKVRHDSSNLNNTGSTYIYAAFAEHPFKLARAR